MIKLTWMRGRESVYKEKEELKEVSCASKLVKKS